MIRTVHFKTKHFDDPTRHPTARAIQDNLKVGYLSFIQHRSSTQVFIFEAEVVKALDQKPNAKMEPCHETNLPEILGHIGDPGYQTPPSFDIDLPEEVLMPENEMGYYNLRGCYRTNANPELFRHDMHFQNIVERNLFYRLTFAMRKTGIDAALIMGIGKLYYELGKGRPVFANPSLPEGFEIMLEVEKKGEQVINPGDFIFDGGEQ